MVPAADLGALKLMLGGSAMGRSLPVLLALVALTVGCDNSGSSSSGGVTGPTVPLTSQTFTGTVDVGGSSSNTTFVVAQSGEVDVTVTALGPPSNIIMGLAIGIPSTTDSSCAAPASAGTECSGLDIAARGNVAGGNLLREAVRRRVPDRADFLHHHRGAPLTGRQRVRSLSRTDPSGD